MKRFLKVLTLCVPLVTALFTACDPFYCVDLDVSLETPENSGVVAPEEEFYIFVSSPEMLKRKDFKNVFCSYSVYKNSERVPVESFNYHKSENCTVYEDWIKYKIPAEEFSSSAGCRIPLSLPEYGTYAINVSIGADANFWIYTGYDQVEVRITEEN